MIQRIYLIIKEIVSNRFINIIVFFSIALSVFGAGLFEVIGNNFNTYIHKGFASSIPPNTIKVSTNLDKPRIITDSAIKKIKGVKGVATIYPVVSMEIPMYFNISAFFLDMMPLGNLLKKFNNYGTDIIAVGVPYNLIYDDIDGRNYKRLWEKPVPGGKVPVLVPKIFLQAVRGIIPKAYKVSLPSDVKLIGRRLNIDFGCSHIRCLEGHGEEEVIIAGFTDKIDVLAIILPIDFVKEYNKRFNTDTISIEYLNLFVKVKDHESILRVSSIIKNMGYDVEVEKTVSRQILNLKKNIDLVINSLKYLIIFLSVVAISFSTAIATLNRIEYYRILRIIGSTKLFITLTILIKYGLLGFIGTFAGLKLIEHLLGYFTQFFNLSGLMISLYISENTYATILIWGTLIPLLSTVPALIRLYTKGLSGD